MTRSRAVYALGLFALLSACARQTVAGAVVAGAPGFLRGLWDGFIFFWSWIVSLFVPEVAIYQVPNNGGWYDFGYFIGIVVFGAGARRTRVVYRTVRRSGVVRRDGGVVEGRVIREDGE